jgi:hypothetical protein
MRDYGSLRQPHAKHQEYRSPPGEEPSRSVRDRSLEISVVLGHYFVMPGAPLAEPSCEIT